MHNKTAIAAFAVIGLLVLGLGATAVAYSKIAAPASLPSQASPNAASHVTTSHSDNESAQGAEHEDRSGGGFPLAVGSSFTLSNLNGTYVSATNESVSGKAAGSFTFQVTGVYAKGYTLSVTSGTLTIGSTTYTITSGTVVLNTGGESGTGSGVASGGSTFLISVSGLHGSLASPSIGNLRLDLMSGTSQFLVSLGAEDAGD